MVNKIDLISDGEFTELVNKSSCISDILRSLGYSTNGNSWGTKIVTERMEKLGLVFTNKNPNFNKTYEKSIPLQKILTKDSGYCRTKLKERLFSEGIKEYKCECCGISEWQGKQLSLQLHHINGINNDNRLENLQILCPNCHSQTDTFTTKGRGLSIINKTDMLSLEDKKMIMDKVREVGIVEARKQLTFRNSIINAVVKANHDIIVMQFPDGKTKEFSTIVEAAKYFQTLFPNKPFAAIRSGISKCCGGTQQYLAGNYTFYRRSLGV